MTGKRFVIMDNLPKRTHSNIWDKQKQHNQGIGDELWLGEVVAMLNEGVILAEENEQLRTALKELKEIGDYQADRIQELSDDNEQLKSTMKEVIELLEEEFDVFSDKALEHDLMAYRELQQLDNKDAYDIATGTKKAIRILKGDVE